MRRAHQSPRTPGTTGCGGGRPRSRPKPSEKLFEAWPLPINSPLHETTDCSISFARLDRGRRLYAHTHVLRAVAEDLFRPANHVRRVYWQPIILDDAADWNQAVGLNQVGKLPG